jgi:CO/xanthine dehydrogenase Mo-binding subunit
LVVSFSLMPARAADPQKPAPLPGSLEQDPLLDSWIRVGADGRVSVFTGKVELGQGIKTALLQIAAEELVIEPSQILLETADTARTPNEGYTAGSQSMQYSGTAILHAAAQARAILVDLAAARLGVASDQLVLQNGTIRAADGRSVRYGELVGGQTLHVRAQPQSTFRDPKTRAYIASP